MLKTNRKTSSLNNNITVSTESLAELLDCGRATAIKIGEAANAKIYVGRRVLWNTSRIKEYLNTPELKLMD